MCTEGSEPLTTMNQTMHTAKRLEFQHVTLVLNSKSPRRLDILKNNLGTQDIVVVSSQFAEDLKKYGDSPQEYVRATAMEKMRCTLSRLGLNIHLSYARRIIVLTADTIVSCGETICEKPASQKEHREMLMRFRDSNRPIHVYTAVNVVASLRLDLSSEFHIHNVYDDVVGTKLVFALLISNNDIDSYILTGEGTDAAGGFKIQGLGSILFSGIEGDYFNVVGLPAHRTYELLQQSLLGFDCY